MQKHYTKVLLVFLLSLNSLFVKGQWVSIPDTNFVNWLNGNGYASCMNGNLMDTTCNAVVNISSVDCSNKNIADLDGIQYFDNLNALDCSNNNLSNLPPLPSLLTNLNCNQNYTLTALPLLPDSLLYLTCRWNSLSTLPPLPSTLISLDFFVMVFHSDGLMTKCKV